MSNKYEECDYCQFSGTDEDVCQFCEDADQFEPASDDYSEGALFSKKVYLLKKVA